MVFAGIPTAVLFSYYCFFMVGFNLTDFKENLENIVISEKIDTITLSSTHLLFLKLLLKKEFPEIEFIDPGNIVATKVFSKIKNRFYKFEYAKFEP